MEHPEIWSALDTSISSDIVERGRRPIVKTRVVDRREVSQSLASGLTKAA